MSAHALVDVLTSMRLAGCTHEQRRQIANELAGLVPASFAAFEPFCHDAAHRRVSIRAITSTGEAVLVDIHYNPNSSEVSSHG